MRLYKYLDPARIDVLKNLMIRYTQPNAMNDPFEFRPHIHGIAEDNMAKNIANNSFDEVLREEWGKYPENIKKAVPFDSIREELEKNRERIIDETPKLLDAFFPAIKERLHKGLNDSIGILSLTEKPDSQLMWAHYANSHEGFVIGFDADHPHFHEKRGPNDELRHLRKVEYKSHRPSHYLVDLSGIDVFLSKGEEWSYEQEWRIFRALSEADRKIDNEPYKIFLFSFPAFCIKEVIFGSRMTQTNRELIVGIIRGTEKLSHVLVQEAIPDEIEFKIDIRQI